MFVMLVLWSVIELFSSWPLQVTFLSDAMEESIALTNSRNLVAKKCTSVIGGLSATQGDLFIYK